MVQLALRGHATRGKEVIEILEMLGGKSYTGLAYKGEDPDRFYCINKVNNFIDSPLVLHDVQVFSLEEFLEKFPYMVGDKVIIKCKNQEAIIDKVVWCCDTITYWLKYNSFIEGNWRTEELEPYKEETMKANKEFKQKYCRNCGSQRCSGDGEWLEECEYYKNEQRTMEEIKMNIPKGYEFAGVDDDKQQVVFTKIQPQYPTTYEECCEVLSLGEKGKLYTKGYKASLIQDFHKLLICRDAYWKIAGEQMGLGKPWNSQKNDDDYCIFRLKGEIVKNDSVFGDSLMLGFPTEEMRDAFYENFKDLIEECKELL